MSAEPAATLVVEYPCERRCQVELDVAEHHSRYTKHQMLVDASAAHKAAHRYEDKVFTRYAGTTVRAGAL